MWGGGKGGVIVNSKERVDGIEMICLYIYMGRRNGNVEMIEFVIESNDVYVTP